MAEMKADRLARVATIMSHIKKFFTTRDAGGKLLGWYEEENVSILLKSWDDDPSYQIMPDTIRIRGYKKHGSKEPPVWHILDWKQLCTIQLTFADIEEEVKSINMLEYALALAIQHCLTQAANVVFLEDTFVALGEMISSKLDAMLKYMIKKSCFNVNDDATFQLAMQMTLIRFVLQNPNKDFARFGIAPELIETTKLNTADTTWKEFNVMRDALEYRSFWNTLQYAPGTSDIEILQRFTRVTHKNLFYFRIDGLSFQDYVKLHEDYTNHKKGEEDDDDDDVLVVVPEDGGKKKQDEVLVADDKKEKEEKDEQEEEEEDEEEDGDVPLAKKVIKTAGRPKVLRKVLEVPGEVPGKDDYVLVVGPKNKAKQQTVKYKAKDLPKSYKSHPMVEMVEARLAKKLVGDKTTKTQSSSSVPEEDGKEDEGQDDADDEEDDDENDTPPSSTGVGKKKTGRPRILRKVLEVPGEVSGKDDYVLVVGPKNKAKQQTVEYKTHNLPNSYKLNPMVVSRLTKLVDDKTKDQSSSVPEEDEKEEEAEDEQDDASPISAEQTKKTMKRHAGRQKILLKVLEVPGEVAGKDDYVLMIGKAKPETAKFKATDLPKCYKLHPLVQARLTKLVATEDEDADIVMWAKDNESSSSSSSKVMSSPKTPTTKGPGQQSPAKRVRWSPQLTFSEPSSSSSSSSLPSIRKRKAPSPIITVSSEAERLLAYIQENEDECKKKLKVLDEARDEQLKEKRAEIQALVKQARDALPDQARWMEKLSWCEKDSVEP